MTDIESRIASYAPSQLGIEAVEQAEIVLIVGITGAGKNTILSEMMKTGDYYDLVTTVTREPRYNNGVLEQEGIDYHFITEDKALELVDAGEYIEVSLVHGRIYGVTTDEVRRARDKGKIALADLDVQGVSKFKRLSDKVTAIFLVPPDYQEWQRRIRERYPTREAFLEDWPKRRVSAITELEKALSAPYYHFVINDDLVTSVEACIKITQGHDRFVRKDDEVRLIARDLLETIKQEDDIKV